MSSVNSVDEKTLSGENGHHKNLDASNKPSGVATPEEHANSPSTDLEATAGKPEVEQEQAPPRTQTGWKWWLLLAGIYPTAFIYGLDTTIAADVQASVVATFHETQDLSWLGTGFLLGSVATILPICVLFNILNVKWFFIFVILLFEIGSAVCGAAPTMNALIVGRVIAGVGGAGIYVGSLAFLVRLTTQKEQGAYVSALAVFWGLGCVIGPLIGGAFAESAATWRWGFYINLVVAAITAPIYLFCLPSIPNQPEKTLMQRLAVVDWVGVVLNAAMWGLFVCALTFAGATWAWSDGRNIALWVVFAVVFIGFILQQVTHLFTTKERRLFPIHLLNSRTQLMLYFGTAASATAVFVPIYYIPLYFQFVHGDSAIQAAVRLLPFVVVAMSLNFAGGSLLPYIPYYALMYTVCGLFLVAGGAALYTIDEATPIANVYGYTILTAIGAGTIFQISYPLASAKLIKQGREKDCLDSVSLMNVAQIGTAALALVIAGQLFQEFAFRNLSAALAGHNFSAVEIQAAVAGAQSVVFETIDATTREAAIAALTAAMSKVWIMIIVAGGVSFFSGLAMKWEKLI